MALRTEAPPPAPEMMPVMLMPALAKKPLASATPYGAPEGSARYCVTSRSSAAAGAAAKPARASIRASAPRFGICILSSLDDPGVARRKVSVDASVLHLGTMPQRSARGAGPTVRLIPDGRGPRMRRGAAEQGQVPDAIPHCRISDGDRPAGDGACRLGRPASVVPRRPGLG